MTTRAPDSRGTSSQNNRERAKKCGSFGETSPRESFLHAFHDVLQCLRKDPIADCVSPPLIPGPLESFSPPPLLHSNDQLRHMSNPILRAKEEVVLDTNFWEKSGTNTFVNDAFIELSNRAAARNGRVVVTWMFDRGAWKRVSP